MVTGDRCLCALATAWLAAAPRGRPGIKRLDRATRAKVLAALTALVILGFGMVVLAWLGARMTRRYMHRIDRMRADRRPSQVAAEDDWANYPLVPGAPEERDEFRDEPESEGE